MQTLNLNEIDEAFAVAHGEYVLKKSISRRNFKGNDALFNSCWAHYRRMLRGFIDYPSNQADVDRWLKQLAVEKTTPRGKLFRSR